MTGSQTLGVLVDVGSDGSIVLPSDMMTTAQITAGGQVEVLAQHGALIMRNASPPCELCGSLVDVQKVGTYYLCAADRTLLKSDL